MLSPGARFRKALVTATKAKGPLQIVGTVNAYAALLARHAGAQALYLSGSGIAMASFGLPDLGITNLHDVNEDARRITSVCDVPLLVDIDTGFGCRVAMASFGLPDLGITNLHDVTEDARRITSVCDVPLLVDIDTGFGGAFGIARTVQEMMRAGVAAVHMEDQAAAKRCGHRPNKQIVSTDEMVDRIKSVVAAKERFAHLDPEFVLIARTDALASEGLDAALQRAQDYLDAGADMLFPEALTDIDQFKQFKQLKDKNGESAKVLANLTEFGKTPLFTRKELGAAGVDMALYPLGAQRAAAKAALRVYEDILGPHGTQSQQVSKMQTREEAYDVIQYHNYEKSLDALFSKEK